MTRWLRHLARRWLDAGWMYDMRRHEVLSKRSANRLESAYLHDRLAARKDGQDG